MEEISFFREDTDFDLPEKERRSAWIQQVITNEGYELAELTYIFCSDEYLLGINQEYLDHDTYTDIVTFDNSEEEKLIEGDIFISVDRVKENAEGLGVTFEEELNRVMVHGVLHLLGYKDKTEEQSVQMRQMEDTCLSLWDA